MPQSPGYDFLLRCVSGVIMTAFTFGIIVETDVLPRNIRHPLRTALHEVGDKAAKLPGVRQVHRAFR